MNSARQIRPSRVTASRTSKVGPREPMPGFPLFYAPRRNACYPLANCQRCRSPTILQGSDAIPRVCSSSADANCSANEHCDALNNCSPDVANGAPCLRDANGSTGICSAGFCAQCTFDGHCSSNQFCNVFGDCENKVPNGSLCVDSRVCQSNCCSFGFCSNC